MEIRDRVELALVGAAAGAVAAVAGRLPPRLDLGDVFLLSAAAILVQGLGRDLARLAEARRDADVPLAPRRVACTCLESGVGVAGILAGASLVLGASLFSVAIPTFAVPRLAWPAALLAVGLAGFAIRDVVFDWRARRFRRDLDHASTVVGSPR